MRAAARVGIDIDDFVPADPPPRAGAVRRCKPSGRLTSRPPFHLAAAFPQVLRACSPTACFTSGADDHGPHESSDELENVPAQPRSRQDVIGPGPPFAIRCIPGHWPADGEPVARRVAWQNYPGLKKTVHHGTGVARVDSGTLDAGDPGRPDPLPATLIVIRYEGPK